MVNVGKSGEPTNAKQPLEVNGQQVDMQKPQPAQKSAAPNCVWTMSEHEHPYGSGSSGIFTRINEHGQPLEIYQDSDTDGSLDIHTTYEYNNGKQAVLNIDFNNDGYFDHRTEFNENGQPKRSITFGLDRQTTHVTEYIYNAEGDNVAQMIDKDNDGKFDEVVYVEQNPQDSGWNNSKECVPELNAEDF